MQGFWKAVYTWWFWGDFWPNFSATLVGAGLGVCGALWLYNRTSRESERLDQLIDILDTALECNARDLSGRLTLTPDTLTIFPDTQIAIWDTLKQDAQSLIRSATIRAGLANHFEKVSRIELYTHARTTRALDRLNHPYFGTSNKEAGEKIEETYRQVLKNHAAEVVDQVPELRAELGRLRAQ